MVKPKPGKLGRSTTPQTRVRDTESDTTRIYDAETAGDIEYRTFLFAFKLLGPSKTNRRGVTWWDDKVNKGNYPDATRKKDEMIQEEGGKRDNKRHPNHPNKEKPNAVLIPHYLPADLDPDIVSELAQEYAKRVKEASRGRISAEETTALTRRIVDWHQSTRQR